MAFGRRGLLLGGLGVLATACARIAPRPSIQPAPPTAAFDAWRSEARGMLSDALQALRTFDVFHAFRVSSAAEAGAPPGAQLAWDPPTSAAWDEATHVARGLHGRAEQLFLAVTTTQIDPNLWREQRALADAAHDLLDLAEALGGYREGLDRLGVGDASGALGQLDKVWAEWEATAARWGVSRAEVIACAR